LHKRKQNGALGAVYYETSTAYGENWTFRQGNNLVGNRMSKTLGSHSASFIVSYAENDQIGVVSHGYA
jgi:hypothetical protein